MGIERYQLQDQIAQGDFATVYRAYDHELKREVAIKQIHQQYLNDPQQLDRYWQEAQLLASLEHPHVTTIYDINRDKGWLILELMQGSLQQLLDGAAIDLSDLRLAITFTLHGLQFMHDNGIVHGDVKPSNLLVDRNNRVKLGDFGIARRLAGDGSVVKGTTKYIAPEVVSDQFGDVGPQSDLYSLGFAAFDLMCGENFDSLFPGLHVHGRDLQMAWMMWHTAPDRRLPEVQKVLQGVPDDLAFIIQRLTEKDPQRRYRTAQEVIDDLHSDGPLKAAPDPEEIARAEKEAKQAKQKRVMLIGAVALSLVLSVSMLFMGDGQPKPVANPGQEVPSGGVMLLVDMQHQRFLLKPEGKKQTEIKIDEKTDVTILLNDKVAKLEQLRGGDRLEIQSSTTGDGRRHLQIKATRPKGQAYSGSLISVNPVERLLAVQAADGNKLQLHVPAAATVRLNGEEKSEKRSFDLADLQEQDQISLTYFPSVGANEQPVAFEISALRKQTINGYISAIDAKTGLVTLRFEQARGGKVKNLPVAKDCQLSLNGLSELAGKPLKITDLQPDDVVEVQHNDHILSLTARRSFRHQGTVTELSSSDSADSLQVTVGQQTVVFALDEKTSIRMAGKQASLPYRYIRPKDQVTITHASPELKDPVASLIEIQPRPDQTGWALVITNSEYDDSRITPLPQLTQDAVRLQKQLSGWLRVPGAQLRLVSDRTKEQLGQQVSDFLSRIPKDCHLTVLVLGNGYRVGKDPVLATKDSRFDRLATTAYSMRTLLSEIEKCPATRKLLVLDTAHYLKQGRTGSSPASQLQVSSAMQIDSLRPSPKRPVSKTVAILASCSLQQKGLLNSDGSGLFASVLAEAYSGKADKNHDFVLSPEELFEFSRREVTARLTKRQQQTPQLFKPDSSPTRLTADAQDAIRKVLAYLEANSATGLDLEFQNAKVHAPKAPEPMLSYALVQLKRGKTADSLRTFQKLIKRHPDNEFAHQALAYQYFRRREFALGVRHVLFMVQALEIKPEAVTLKPLERELLQFAGVLRAFAASVAMPQRKDRELEPIDQHVASYGKSAQQAYESGRKVLERRLKNIDRTIGRSKTVSERNKLQRSRRQIASYARIPYSEIRDHLLRIILE